MKLFDTLAERYRRHRAIHKYDRWLRFWLFDTVIFLVKLTLVAGVVFSIYHYTPLVPSSVKYYVENWSVDPTRPTGSVPSSPTEIASATLEQASADTQNLPEKTVIPASLTPTSANQATPALKVVTIAVSRANLREGPTTSSAVVGQLRKGSKITLFALSERWAQVATNDELGISGYVHVSLLEEDETRLRQQFVSP